MVELIAQLLGISILSFLILILAFIVLRRFVSGPKKEYLGLAVGIMTLIFALAMIYFWVAQGKSLLELFASNMLYWLALFFVACIFMIGRSYINLKKIKGGKR
jgi:hypothetical protein